MTDHCKTAAIPEQATTLFASLELGRARWLVTISTPKSDKLSRHSIAGGDGAALLQLLFRLRSSAERKCGETVSLAIIQEAGLDGFWLHRLLQREGIESYVVDPASIAVNRRHRRAKTDVVDGDLLVRTLMAWSRGERQVCSMVEVPSPDAEDQRRLSRERARLIKERIAHTNRIKGLLFGQGVSDFDPLRPDRRMRLAALQTGDGRALPERLRGEIARELDRLELALSQIAEVEGQRDALLARMREADADAAPAMLMRLRGIGPEFASLLWLEALFRRFNNRRQIAAYAGLAPSPWQSGSINREQGITKAGNPRLRHTMVELA